MNADSIGQAGVFKLTNERLCVGELGVVQVVHLPRDWEWTSVSAPCQRNQTTTASSCLLCQYFLSHVSCYGKDLLCRQINNCRSSSGSAGKLEYPKRHGAKSWPGCY